jgi:hypothetical protein
VQRVRGTGRGRAGAAQHLPALRSGASHGLRRRRAGESSLNTYLHCVAAPRTAFAAAVQEATLVLLNPKLSCFGIKTGSGNI